MLLDISDDDLSAFLVCFGLGALYATFQKNVPQAGGGLLTLSTPKMIFPPRDKQVVSEDIANILMWAEDMTTIKEHYSEKEFETVFNERVDSLCQELRKSDPNRIWSVRWMADPE